MNREYRNNKKEKKKSKALIIIFIICFLIALLSLKIIFFPSTTIEKEKIYAGIGGAINDGGVYEVNEDTRIYELIVLAKGLKERANIKNIDIEETVIPFEVYCM